MQKQMVVSPGDRTFLETHTPKEEEEKKVGTLGEVLSFITEHLGTHEVTPDRVTKKGTMVYYHQPRKRRAKRQTQRHSRQINARKARG
jgi:hypothetical protein